MLNLRKRRITQYHQGRATACVMSSFVALLSRFRNIEADEMIDFKAETASNVNKKRLIAKSLFTQPVDRPQYWPYKLKRKSKIPFSKSEIGAVDITQTWDKDRVAAPSQRWTDFRADFHQKLHGYTTIGQNQTRQLSRRIMYLHNPLLSQEMLCKPRLLPHTRCL